MCEEVDGCERMKGFVKVNMIWWWWMKIKFEDWVLDLVYIVMVVVVGNCFIEVVGYFSFIIWCFIFFYNVVVVYVWLILLFLIFLVLC